ncbi:hypothetical protein [Microbulbifer epialgicus]|uniref:ABC transporter permease n=1 Tax=Microbulbifer epialgicus TaxID=393907 RepID=A0ABV4P6K6_9GAMM
MFNKLFLLVYGQIFSAETKREKDLFSAKISASVQMALLITLNLVSVFFLTYALVKTFTPIDIIGAHRKLILTIVGSIMLILILAIYSATCTIGDVGSRYFILLNREIATDSKLPTIAKAYPILSLVCLGCSIVVLTLT